ncbi:MAG: hypothetical protein HOP04_10845 [Methylophilaceae bacterium]|nr:hypothetical protein [Methylophilaceae bacterium]
MAFDSGFQLRLSGRYISKNTTAFLFAVGFKNMDTRKTTFSRTTMLMRSLQIANLQLKINRQISL